MSFWDIVEHHAEVQMLIINIPRKCIPIRKAYNFTYILTLAQALVVVSTYIT